LKKHGTMYETASTPRAAACLASSTVSGGARQLTWASTRSFFARTSSVLIHISSIALRSASEQEKDSPFVPQTKTALKPSATR